MKGLRIIGLAAVWLGLATPARAVEFTPEQRELIDVIRTCNDAWSASIEKHQYEVFTAACPSDQRAQWWYTTSETPAEFGGPNGLWQYLSMQNSKNTWHGFEPLAVEIFGDLALVYFAVTWVSEARTGRVNQNPSRRVTTLQRRGDGWVMVGGSIATVPVAPDPQ